MLKNLCVLNSKIEAEMLCQMLQAQGIDCFVNGSREYASIVTGADIGHYQVQINEEDVELATSLLAQVNLSLAQPEPIPQKNQSHFKRAIFLCAMALMLPIIMNFVSIKPFIMFWRTEQNMSHKLMGAFVYVALQLITLAPIYYLGIIIKPSLF